ncbi:TetR/AcrR family transcriptional regulator [Marinomonas pollencensis]|uniref:TetR family transcriptional regulator n=1 Tax=Marinomonas pollencensis TaxID=491954 RepID=A0A3E0DRV9_9GAMM|nr:TetR/AcrR family transcriptional regulator [Marinomonas pollencensis]REG85885.1 TetR family transcriptional regulator [Marinomonas pollencensis]
MSKHEDILNSAEWLFYNEGFHRTGVAKIANTAGTTQRTLYKHFASKEELILCILERRETSYWHLLNQLEAANQRLPLPKLYALLPFQALQDWYQTRASCGCFFMHALAEYRGKNSAIENYVENHKQRMRATFVRLLSKDGFSDTTTANTLMILLEGVTALSALQTANELCQQAYQCAENTLKNNTIKETKKA